MKPSSWEGISVFLFACFSFYCQTGSHCVTLAGLELSVQNKLASNSLRSMCLCLRSPRIKSIQQHCLAICLFCVCKVLELFSLTALSRKHGSLSFPGQGLLNYLQRQSSFLSVKLQFYSWNYSLHVGILSQQKILQFYRFLPYTISTLVFFFFWFFERGFLQM